MIVLSVAQTCKPWVKRQINERLQIMFIYDADFLHHENLPQLSQL